MSAANGIQDTVKSFIMTEFLSGEDPDNLQPSTPLITAGILDSIATLQLVTFLEKTYGIELQAHEVGVDHLNTVEDIARLIASKRK